MLENESRPWQAGGDWRDGAGQSCLSAHHSTMPEAGKQGPSGDLPVYYRDGLIYVAGRHLCSVRGDELQRTFDGGRELLRGGLAFRVDVLELAEAHGARAIVATERASKRTYHVDLATFRRLAWLYDSPTFGRQLCLALDRWALEPEPGAAVQLGMFAEVVR